ncbi:WXG100 family type VII secretion target [Kitasatospora sp. NPDC004240]
MSYTDFHQYSHGDLRKMVQALNSGEVMAAGDPWRRAATTLKAIRATLTRASTDAAVSWEGVTSDAFHSRMLHLANTINNAASYANDAANTLKSMAEAIDQAKREMPEEPGNWDKLKDGVGDTLSSAFGGDDEDTKTPVADQKRAEAIAVMQTLALKYRTAAPILKPVPPAPPPPPGKGGRNDEFQEQPDSGSAAIGALMAGSGPLTGSTQQRRSGNPAPSAPKSITPTAPKRAPAPPPPPTDAGIKGGTAQTIPKPPSTANVGPGTGLDSANHTLPSTSNNTTTTPTTTGPGTGTNPNQPGTPPGGQGSGYGNKPFNGGGSSEKPPGGSQPKTGGPTGKAPAGGTNPISGPAGTRAGNAFGTGGIQGGGLGPVGGAARGGKAVADTGRRSGSVVGGSEHAPAGSSGKRAAFTEGGSGLGARGRIKSEMGATAGMSGMAPGMPIANAQRRKKDEENGGKRPDYLVEDEETWASDKPRNPNVVE